MHVHKNIINLHTSAMTLMLMDAILSLLDKKHRLIVDEIPVCTYLSNC